MGVVALHAVDRRFVVGVDVDAHRIAGLKTHLLENTGHFPMALHIPVNRPQRVAHRIDAVGVVTAQVDAHFVLGDQGIGFGKKNIDLVEVVVQDLGQLGLQIGQVVKVVIGDLEEFDRILNGQPQDGVALMTQGKILQAGFVAFDKGNHL
ncbi:hypothetical protein DESC_480174 [Desulfosarcina cetonica]|nr:hypothetical protein DESC_480174 [Desulfosarcina cetonica]